MAHLGPIGFQGSDDYNDRASVAPLDVHVDRETVADPVS